MFRRLSSRSPGLTLVSQLLIPALLHQALLLPRPFTLMLLLPRPPCFSHSPQPLLHSPSASWLASPRLWFSGPSPPPQSLPRPLFFSSPVCPGPSRLFCPVASCPDHAPPSHGWLSFQTMRPHVEAHLSGQLVGDISSDWLRSHGFGTCEVCRRILSLRFNGRCPSCFHSLTASRCRPSSAFRPFVEGASSIWDVFTSGTRVRSSVPAAARDAWSRCLIVALADVVAHRDARSWTDLLTLPALVLTAPSRGGRRHTLRLDHDKWRRCLDWVNGIRAELWTPHHGKRGKDFNTVDDADALPDAVVSRVATLLQEGALRRACAASDDVVAALRDFHPAPEASDRAGMQPLRRVSPRAAPVADVERVRKAVHSFPSTSGAGRSGLRPSHIRDATRPASSDLLFRLISEVVNLLLQERFPSPFAHSSVERPSWLFANLTGHSVRSQLEKRSDASPARWLLNSSRIGHAHS